MPQHLQILDVLLVFVLPAALFLAWPRLDGTLVIPIFAALAIGYLANGYFNHVSQEHVFKEIQAKQAHGEALTPEDETYDGVGNNVFALMCGWLPAAIAILVALPFKLLAHRLLRLRQKPSPDPSVDPGGRA